MSDSNYASDEEFDEGASSLSRAMDALMTRLRPLVSKKFQKAYMGILLFISTALFMIGVSTVAYFVFYYKFIPQVELQRPVHLQFGDGPPWGTAPLGTELATLQPYDVTIRLELPRTPSNLAAGNFMLDLSLLSHRSSSAKNPSRELIARSRRPAILTYASPLVDTASKLTFMPLYLTGWRREAETLEVQMMEQIEFPRGWRNLPETLRIEIHSDEKMHVYNAKVEFRATFTGLRWFVYNWKITSFFIFSFMFWSISMVSMSVVWLVLAYMLSTAREIRETERGGTPIKEESDDESADPAGFPSSGHGQPPEENEAGYDSEEEVKQEPSPSATTSEAGDDNATDSTAHGGTGTGIESAEARGVQRRRSHLFKVEDS